MVNDTRLEEFRILWTDHLSDYILVVHDGKSTVCNRDTQIPIMIEDNTIRAAVVQKFIEAGIEKIISSDHE
ncbi:MAG: hypothetical protein Q9P44_13320 [Anaerolineae bacterium]|nr:hypothetical protein [Anaerolineae bacterium]